MDTDYLLNVRDRVVDRVSGLAKGIRAYWEPQYHLLVDSYEEFLSIRSIPTTRLIVVDDVVQFNVTDTQEVAETNEGNLASRLTDLLDSIPTKKIYWNSTLPAAIQATCRKVAQEKTV